MNVADQITEQAMALPHKRSVVAVSGKDSFGNYRYVHYTFIQLEKRINQFANSLKKNGVSKGDKVLVFVKPCLDFSAIAFALFKMGACPVFIDPGMGKKAFLSAVKECAPKVLIGIPKALFLQYLFFKWFKSVKIRFVYAPFSLPGAKSLAREADKASFAFDSETMSDKEPAAILFTSGGTGRPKGVVYTHDIFISQTKALKEEFGLTSDDVDVPGFPLFALFTLSMGMTSCIPDMDPSRPSKADPIALKQIIMDHGATFAAGSPAIWKNLGLYCSRKKMTLPTMNHLVMFGAPIPLVLHELFSKVLPSGDTHTPYGATESLPVSNTQGSILLKKHRLEIEDGKGVFVGSPLSQVSVKIIEPTDAPIDSIEKARELSAYQAGEIIVRSPTTTKSYYQLPQKTLETKIQGENGDVWHRMGDMGYLDYEGGLWFCGRKAHVVLSEQGPLLSVNVEAIFNKHPEVARSALVFAGSGPALALERHDGAKKLPKEGALRFKEELLALGQQKDFTKGISRFFLCGSFPVDVRHNIKIDRKKLGRMAQTSLEQV